jgi:hypothetical protein
MPPTEFGFSPPRPESRRLRVYAFDPSLSARFRDFKMNDVAIEMPWEESEGGYLNLSPGPIGEYLEVVDFDPVSGCFYWPVDLDHPYLVASNGLAPSEGTPQFHQQMVYAVTMRTIRTFEQALGRVALWAPGIDADSLGSARTFVQRLRIYPHALREKNAYYDPGRKAILYGYFPEQEELGGMPNGIVFTCLSHDIIAHETVHALLDGLYPRFMEPTNPDVWAFHEAFADIVALLQHFSIPEVLKSQLSHTRGNLKIENLLGELAQQFGRATGARASLRDAIGAVDPNTGTWHRKLPDPFLFKHTIEPHARGAIFVSALFDAFIEIYEAQSADLLRLATGGTGILPAGSIPPDLVNRLAAEAAKAASHLLNICIRGLDYCPPVDITFGDYVRAVITADYDLVRNDDRGYRVAIVEAIRNWGIWPRGVRTLSEDTLRWTPVSPQEQEILRGVLPGEYELQELRLDWTMRPEKRRKIFEQDMRNRAKWYEIISKRRNEGVRGLIEAGHILGLDFSDPTARFELHSLRPAKRTRSNGQTLVDVVLTVLQRREEDGFTFRGGCTVIIDHETAAPRYIVRKSFHSTKRLNEQRAFSATGGEEEFDPYGLTF